MDLHKLYDEEEFVPTSVHELKPKMKLNGTVSKVELFGAFIDIGVGVNGLVHISQLSTERTNRVADVISEGDQIAVWVSRVDPKNKRIGLTMIEPPAVDWDEVRAGQVYTGRIKRLERFGAFVDIGLTRDGLVHVSELTTGYIEHPSEIVKVDEEIQVKILKIDHKKRRIELSLKALEEEIPLDEDEDEDKLPTAMELALRQAEKQAKKDQKQRKARKSSTGRQQEQDDIISRTLSSLRDQG